MAEKKRVVWIELLRILSCFSVVLIHMGSQHFRDVPVDSFTWTVSNWYHGFPRYAVGCFIMISGALYLDKRRKWDLKKLFFKNVLPIGVTYVFWQIFYAVYFSFKANLPFMSKAFLKEVFIRCSEPYFHLWYLPMLLGLLIITPLLWEFVNCENGKKLEEYFLIMFFIFKIVNVSIGFLPLPYKTHINNYMDTVQPDLITGYAGYYILGHYLHHYELPKKLEKMFYILGTFFIIAAVLMCQYFAVKNGKPVQSHYENYTFASFFWCGAVYLFFKNYVSRIQWKERTERMIFTLSGCTFGIYLIHALIRDVFYRNGIETMIFNEIFSIPVLAIFIFVICYALVWIIKKIPMIGKWIV